MSEPIKRFERLNDAILWVFNNSEYFHALVQEEVQRMHDNGDIEVTELANQELGEQANG